MTDYERLAKFVEAFKQRRPNSPIVKGVKHDDGEKLHLMIEDVERLLALAKPRLGISLPETKLPIVNVYLNDPHARRQYSGL